MFRFLFLLAAGMLLLSCNQQDRQPHRHITPAFYYWKSIYSPNPYEANKLRELHVQTQYIKFFDVGWNNDSKKPQPLAVIRFDKEYREILEHVRPIPVVFITNECIRQLDSASAESLAVQILQLVRDIQSVNQLQAFHELQIDCDWTVSTKEVYFVFLNYLKKLDPQLLLSVTIRLHQVKYIAKAGVPPVHRGLLMCYNMGNLRNPATVNSILDPGELKKYLGHLNTYPLPLDIALPLFSWSVVFRNGSYVGLLKIRASDLPVTAVSRVGENRFRLNKDTVLAGFDCRKNDEIRYESSELQQILQASDYLGQHWKDTSARIAFFHLDSIILQKYSTHDLEIIIDRFR